MRPSCILFLALALLFSLFSVSSFHIEVPEEQIEGLLAGPAYTEDMRNVIRQRIREGRHWPDWQTNSNEYSAEAGLQGEGAPRLSKRGYPELPRELPRPRARQLVKATNQHRAIPNLSNPKRSGLATGSLSIPPRFGSRSLSAQLANATILEWPMVADRAVLLAEDAMTEALGAWLSLWRMSDTAEMYFNKVIGLNSMAYNLSVSAAQMFDNFTAIPWTDLFEDEVVCNLNFRQEDQDEVGEDQWAFAYPNYCVENIASASFSGNRVYELHQLMLSQNEALLLNNDFNQISLACATPVNPTITPTYTWYCWMYFVQLSDVINSSRCQCASRSCCPTTLGL